MKIEHKDNNFVEFLNALLKLETIPVRAIKFDTEFPDFKTVLSGLDDKKDNLIAFSLDSMTKEDMDFFRLVSQSKEITVQNLNPKDMQVTFTALEEGSQQVSYKTVNFSKGLFNLIEYSFKTQKPVRLDFQGSSSVILRVNTEGKLTAEFISNDAAMEYALKSSIPGLKQKMDSEGIPYEDIYYKDSNKRQNNNKKRDKGGDK